MQNDPSTSTRQIAANLNTSHQKVWRTLRRNRMKPYKIHVCQALHLGDNAKRIQWCNWLLGKVRVDANFLSKVLWTDECKFTNSGMFNRHNAHYWSSENPRQYRETRPQVRFGINIWIGMLGENLIGPYIYEENLTAERYERFLRTQLMDYLEDIPLNQLREIWWHQDGAPAHTSREARIALNELFPNKWIGKYGSIEWPPRSPDLSPLDYFLWGHLKNEVYQVMPTSLEQLRARIVHAIAQISRRSIRRAINNMLRRARLCLNQNGEQFQHLL